MSIDLKFVLFFDGQFQDFSLNINVIIFNDVINHYVSLGMIHNVNLENNTHVLNFVGAPEKKFLRAFSTNLTVIDDLNTVITVISRFI